ncbi:MAG: hypothetical protein WB781_08990 [Candidatus Sulfotelmatobacter sp.]
MRHSLLASQNYVINLKGFEAVIAVTIGMDTVRATAVIGGFTWKHKRFIEAVYSKYFGR